MMALITSASQVLTLQLTSPMLLMLKRSLRRVIHKTIRASVNVTSTELEALSTAVAQSTMRRLSTHKSGSSLTQWQVRSSASELVLEAMDSIGLTSTETSTPLFGTSMSR